MAYATAAQTRRWPGAVAAAVVQASIAVLVIKGLAAHYVADRTADSPPLVAFAPRPPEPPPSPPPAKAKPEREEAGGAPPAPKAAPREAPRPKVALAPPRPAASVAGSGNAQQSGLAQAGSGSGAGGTGTGTGTGSGAGSGSGATSPPVRVAGGISDRDYPGGAARRGAAGTVGITFRVRSDGRVDRCAVIGSSGDGELDGLTCNLVERRFVYRPARDAAGQPRDTTLRTTFTWGVRRQ
jgi:protein TonB